MSSSLIIAKREKVALPLPLKKSLIDLTVKTSGSHKRKTLEAIDLNLENLGADESVQKLLPFFSRFKCFYYISFSILLVSNNGMLISGFRLCFLISG